MLREPVISFDPQLVIVLLLLRRITILSSNILGLGWNLDQFLSFELCWLDHVFCALFLLSATSVIEIGSVAVISLFLPLVVLILA